MLFGRFWDSRMGDGGDWFQRHVLLPAILALIGDPTQKVILDAGCGNGHLARTLAQSGGLVTAVDFSQDLVQEARKRENKVPLGIEYRCGDLCEPSFLPGLGRSFDIIVCNMVVQDIEDYVGLLEAFKKTIKGHGHLVISTKHPCFSPDRAHLGWQLDLPGGTQITSGFGLTSLERYEQFTGVYFLMDDYFARRRVERLWTRSMIVTSFSRTLEDYVRALVDTGFTIEAIVEPLPTAKGFETRAPLAALLRRIPNFIIFSATPWPGPMPTSERP